MCACVCLYVYVKITNREHIFATLRITAIELNACRSVCVLLWAKISIVNITIAISQLFCALNCLCQFLIDIFLIFSLYFIVHRATIISRVINFSK